MITPAVEIFLRRALRLAMNGRGRVEPNPMVGCVLVKNGQIIGEGFHARFGGPHAEPTALADCHARGNDPRGATAYVTLEPCCHTNKKTPPCAPRLIEAGIARVVIGCLDPNPDVDGKGVAMLRAAGLEVDVAAGVLNGAFRQLIAPFTRHSSTGRPYMTLKWAEDRHGRMAGPGGVRRAISGSLMNAAVHRLRGRCDAILVGINTVLNDDPHLLPRDVEAARTPTRVVLDSSLRIPLESKLVRTVGDGRVLVLAVSDTSPDRTRKVRALRDKGVDVVDHLADDVNTGPAGRLSGWDIAEVIREQNWSHLLVEPGPTLAARYLPFAERVWVIRSDTDVSDATSPQSPRLPRSLVETDRLAIGPDVLTEYLNTNAEAFVAATPSADFVLEAEKQMQPRKHFEAE